MYYTTSSVTSSEERKGKSKCNAVEVKIRRITVAETVTDRTSTIQIVNDGQDRLD